MLEPAPLAPEEQTEQEHQQEAFQEEYQKYWEGMTLPKYLKLVHEDLKKRLPFLNRKELDEYLESQKEYVEKAFTHQRTVEDIGF